jgi:transposase-like protein
LEELVKSVLDSPKRIRRTHSKAFKAQLVALANSGKQSVAQIAMDHKLNANQLRKWMKESDSREGTHQLVPVRVEQSEQLSLSGTPVMELNVSGVLIRFHHGWDPDAVARLIKAVR